MCAPSAVEQEPMIALRALLPRRQTAQAAAAAQAAVTAAAALRAEMER
jgi:hypothetical protein